MTDLLGELEAMADNAMVFETERKDNDVQATARWTELFGYTADEAQTALERLQNGLDRIVPLSLWENERMQQESLGHDRLTYSHWLLRSSSRKVQQYDTAGPPSHDTREFLVQLGGPLDSPASLAQLLGYRTPPPTFTALSGETGCVAQFCRIDTSARAILLARLAHVAPDFSPLIVSSSYAKKELCAHSFAPSLGSDTTLPQYRLANARIVPQPMQDQYPVWYFFYGTLCDTATLRNLFGHLDTDETEYALVPARSRGGFLGTCGAGKYKALVDGPSDAIVEGLAFLVESKEHEDALCFYETGMYDVVRCKIEMVGSVKPQAVDGCTFRFIGELD